MQEELRGLLDDVMFETGRDSEASLNAYIGSKSDDFIDLRNEVIRTPEEYVNKWIQGLDDGVKDGRGGRWQRMHDDLKNSDHDNFRKYCELFLKRSFLKHYDELSKKRPSDEETHYWIGLNDAYMGLFITPRFNPRAGEWENDKSEIRAFKETYWTIGHVLSTGLCYPGEDRKREFGSVGEYLYYFYDQIRLTKSSYQLELYFTRGKFLDFPC